MTAASNRFSIGKGILWIFTLWGLALMVYRFSEGLGSVTNLNDGYPWGLWIAVDVLAGIALASGGFIVAGTVHLLGGRKFHALVRPAIFTAFLGYLLFILGLMVDLGRPWNIWRALFWWNHESPMFEVAWCVTLYTFVLFLEFLPVILEKFRLKEVEAAWKSVVPWLVIIMLGLFTFAMSNSTQWTLAVVVILMAWELCMRAGLIPRDAQIPVLLIMAGVIFSTLHQSSLGSLFLIVPHKLHVLWFSPILPVLFFLSAVMVGPAMVIFESLVGEKGLGHKTRLDLLSGLSRAMPYLLALYLLLKVADLVGRGGTMYALALNPQAISWWGEIVIGVIVPLILFMTPEVIRSRTGLLLGSGLVVAGLVWNRVNVAIVGIIVREWETYHPYWAEIFISIGIVSIGVLVYEWAGKNLPIFKFEQNPSS